MFDILNYKKLCAHVWPLYNNYIKVIYVIITYTKIIHIYFFVKVITPSRTNYGNIYFEK